MSGAAPAADPTPGELAARLRAAGCVYAQAEAGLLLEQFAGAELDDAVRRREGGEPLEHVLGWADFCGLRIAVRSGVFIPRSRAEPLARAAVAQVLSRPAGMVVLDLGCGTGAVAATLADASGPGTVVWASEVDPAAVACARLNAATFGFRVAAADWFDGLPERLSGRLDVVVAYLPHVPDARLVDIPTDYRRAEHDVAVVGGPDGLDPLRQVVAGLDAWLAENGVLFTMVAVEQLDTARDLLRRSGWSTALVESADEESSLLSVRRGPRRGPRREAPRGPAQARAQRSGPSSSTSSRVKPSMTARST